MTLPSSSIPEFEDVLPSTGEKIKYRPFLVKEQKILYMALESGDVKDIATAVTNMLQNCILTPGIDINSLPSFDTEYLFLKLRGKSVGEVIDVSLSHQNKPECTHQTKIAINIDDIKVKENPDHKKTIQIDENIGVKLQYPSLTQIVKYQGQENNTEKLFELLASSIELVFDKDTTYDDFTLGEAKEWIEGLSKGQFDMIMEFFATMPKLKHEVTFTCDSCGETEKLTLEGLQSFFT